MNNETLAKQITISPLSAQTIFYHQTIADCLDLNATDHKCILYLFEGRKTMGQLSALTGLTMGAQTAAIERLEKAGYVQRIHDDVDRRRVYVEMIPANVKKIATLFTSLGKSIAKLESSYTPNELELIHTYMQRTADILYEETLTLKESFMTKSKKSK